MVLALALLCRLVDLDRLLNAFRSAPLWVVFMALGIAVVRTWLTSVRWRLLNPDPSRQLRGWQYFRYMMISNTFNLFMPGALGGDLARSMMVAGSVSRGRGWNLFAILVDRIVGLSSIMILGIAACLLAPSLPQRMSYLLMLAGICLVFFGILFLATTAWTNRTLRRLARHLGRMGERVIRLLDIWEGALAFYRAHFGRLVTALLLCLPIHASWFVVVYAFAQSLGVEISFLAIATVTVLVWVITAIPVSFGGVGVRELSFVYLLSLQGVPNEQAVALSLYCFLVTVLLAVVGLPLIFVSRARPISEMDSNVA